MDNDQRLSSLMYALSFSPEDLAANREGKLGDGQKKRFRRQSWLFLAMFGFVGLALATVFLISSPGTSNRSIYPIAIGMVLSGLLIGLFGFWETRRRLKAGQVKSYKGKVTFTRGPNFNWMLVVTGQPVELAMDIREYIDPAIEYRVYVSPSGREVVSLEPA